MSKILMHQVTNANLYVNDNCMLGRAEELELPKLVALMMERKSLGMVGKIELPSGFDKMGGNIKWASYYDDVMMTVANPFKMVKLMARSSVDTYDSETGRASQKPLVTFLSVMFKEAALGTFKQNDPAEFPSAFSCYYIKQVYDGKDVVEFDSMANIFKIGGVDELEIYRNNIGG